MPVSVEIVAIGTEILLGQLLDTNSAFIARALAGHGVDVYAKHAVGDNAARLEAMLRGALERAGGVVTTGGLGPTVDDLTKDAVAASVGTTLELHEPSVRAIEERFRALGRSEPIGENNRRQAILPKGALVMPNPNGTAPGFIALRDDGKFVACMPGVPREMKPMLTDTLLPWLVERYRLREAIYTRTLHTVGISESDVDRRIEPLFRTLENPKIAVLAHEFKVDVKIMAKAPDRAAAEGLIAPVEAELRAQIEATLRTGVDVTHLDAHMGTVMCPEFVDIYVELGLEYKLPILLVRDYNAFNPRSYSGPMSNDSYNAALERAIAKGFPVFDLVQETMWDRKVDAETAYGEMFERLPEGMTFLSLHFNAPGDFEVIEPSHAYIRTDEYALFRTAKIKNWLAANGIEIVGMRTMRDWLRSEWSRKQ